MIQDDPNNVDEAGTWLQDGSQRTDDKQKKIFTVLSPHKKGQNNPNNQAASSDGGKWSPSAHEKFENIERIELERTSDDEEFIEKSQGYQKNIQNDSKADRDEPEQEKQLNTYRGSNNDNLNNAETEQNQDDDILNVIACHESLSDDKDQHVQQPGK